MDAEELLGLVAVNEALLGAVLNSFNQADAAHKRVTAQVNTSFKKYKQMKKKYTTHSYTHPYTRGKYTASVHRYAQPAAQNHTTKPYIFQNDAFLRRNSMC